MRTNVTRQFRSRERKCMGTKRPGTGLLPSPLYTACAALVVVSLRRELGRGCLSVG